MKNICKYICILLLQLSGFCGCVSSNFHSGKIIEEDKTSFTLGCDFISVENSDKTTNILQYVLFIPSVGFIYGLPSRFEAGVRYYPPFILEASIRGQITPREFKNFDLSVNLSTGYFYRSYTYLKYGATVSKDLNGWEPYLHYNLYTYIGDVEDGFGSSINKAIDWFVNNSHMAGIGVGITCGKIKLFPEIDYQFMNPNFEDGFFRFGLGFNF